MTLAEQWMAEGRAEGEARGEARGRAEGLRAALLSLLSLKFEGQIDESVKRRLDEADEAQLSGWTVRVLDAESVADVLS